MVNISDVFIGTKQSRFAGIAIFTAIIIVCISILFTNTDISLGQRFSIVIFLILISIPSVFLSLFELTCIVTGGNPKTHILCHYFAWIVAFIIFVYCGLIIISVILSMFTYNSAMDKVKENEQNKRVSKEDANKIAITMISSDKNNAPSQSLPTLPTNSAPSAQAIPAAPSAPYKNSINPASLGDNIASFENQLSISPSPMLPNNMNFNASAGFDNNQSLSEWKPMSMPNNIKPISNSGGNLRTSADGSVPEPYINENFSLF